MLKHRFLFFLNVLQVQRLREELTSSRAQLAKWDERINQARAACAAWQLESEEAKRKASLAEQQRDEVKKNIERIGICTAFELITRSFLYQEICRNFEFLVEVAFWIFGMLRPDIEIFGRFKFITVLKTRNHRGQ